MERNVNMKKMIVIGAGILGASTAYHLAKMGADVTLIDRKDAGQATDAAAGILCPWVSQRRNQAWYRLARAGARFYSDFIEELKREGETETGYARVGALLIHTEAEKLDKMEERARQRRADAPEIGEITRLSERETKARFPLLEAGYQSLHISGAARIDGRALRDALIRSAQRKGAVVVNGDASLIYENNRVTGVRVGEKSYAGDGVVICAGAWADALFEPLGLRFLVRFQKAQIMHLRVEGDQDTGIWPVVMPPSDQYLLAFDRRKIVIGATHENEVDGYDTRITPGGMQEILNKGLAAAPGLANSTFQEMRVGFRPFTPGFLPVAGKIPGWDGLFTANGLGASGLTTGPFIGSQLAKMALDQPTDIDFSDYDVSLALDDPRSGLE